MITTKQREYCENLIYQVMDALDPKGLNSAHYKEMFAEMDDKEFTKFISLPFPYKFYVRPFEVEPNMEQIKQAADVLEVPILEKINLNFLYKNSKGEAVQSKECLVGYIPIKKMKQFITKKNAMSTDISERDMKTGLLVGFDKNGTTSDREMEALAITGLYNSIEEFSRSRADSMKAKSNMYNTINTTGKVSLKDCKADIDDSLAKNLIDVYMTGALLKTNILSENYETPRTMRDKQKKVERK